MTAAQRMKQEMTRAVGRKSGSISLEEQLDALDVSDHDRAEVSRFAEFLKDTAVMKLPQLVEKHGADYLGLNPAEVEAASGPA